MLFWFVFAALPLVLRCCRPSKNPSEASKLQGLGWSFTTFEFLKASQTSTPECTKQSSSQLPASFTQRLRQEISARRAKFAASQSQKLAEKFAMLLQSQATMVHSDQHQSRDICEIWKVLRLWGRFPWSLEVKGCIGVWSSKDSWRWDHLASFDIAIISQLVADKLNFLKG